MRIALLGLGDIAQKAYLPLVTGHTEIVPLLCTRNAQVLAQFAQQYRIEETYSDLAELIAAKPDAVMIHSATSSHFAIATRLLQAGIAVFVDKPVSDRLPECEQLINLAEQKNLPFFVGFNRRYAPLYQPALATKPLQVHYQKHRHNQCAPARTFIYDDFIHVVDFVRHVSGVSSLQQCDFQLFQHSTAAELCSVQLQWHYKDALFSAAMNRMAGSSFERLEYFSQDQHWQIDNLRQGEYSCHNQRQVLGFDDWQSTLYKRGFVAMLDQFIQLLKTGKTDSSANNAALLTHQLCEKILERLPQHLDR